MSDYISREAALDAIYRSGTYFEMCDELKGLPAADVRENVRGEWITPSEKIITEDGNVLMDIFFVQCSICGVESLNLRVKRFCPNCGADMRGGNT